MPDFRLLSLTFMLWTELTYRKFINKSVGITVLVIFNECIIKAFKKNFELYSLQKRELMINYLGLVIPSIEH